jgi:hypothetical protein
MGTGEWLMKLAFFAFLVFLGAASFLLTFIADRQARLEQDRLSIRKAPHSMIEADLKPMFVSHSSPYMRTER